MNDDQKSTRQFLITIREDYILHGYKYDISGIILDDLEQSFDLRDFLIERNHLNQLRIMIKVIDFTGTVEDINSVLMSTFATKTKFHPFDIIELQSYHMSR